MGQVLEFRQLQFLVTSVCSGLLHRRTGRGGEGGGSPPQILGNPDFLGSTRKFGQSQFLKTSACFYYYFEEMNISYFNLKSA